MIEMENDNTTLDTKNAMTKNDEWHFTSYGGSVIDAGIFQDKDLLKCPTEYSAFEKWLKPTICLRHRDIAIFSRKPGLRTFLNAM